MRIVDKYNITLDDICNDLDTIKDICTKCSRKTS